MKDRVAHTRRNMNFGTLITCERQLQCLESLIYAATVDAESTSHVDLRVVEMEDGDG